MKKESEIESEAKSQTDNQDEIFTDLERGCFYSGFLAGAHWVNDSEMQFVEKSAYDELKAALEFYADKDGENWAACRPDDTQYTCCHMIGEPSGGSVAREVLKRHS